MCELFSNVSIIVQTQQPKNHEHQKFTLEGKKMFFELKCAYLSSHVSDLFAGCVEWMPLQLNVVT